MRIDSVDFFYLAMPDITDEVDGSQDALLVRVRAEARAGRGRGFRAARSGWGRPGKGALETGVEQVGAAREGLGAHGILLLDAGVVWGDNPAPAMKRAEAPRAGRLPGLEEPFV